MDHMVDRRCPRCNAPVRGREDVVLVKSVAADRKMTQCGRCKRAVRFVEAPVGGTGPDACASFDVA